MIIILEGCDGSGKTTLANELAARYGGTLLNEGPPPVGINLLEYYGAKLDKWRGRRTIFDRLALGERVYGPIYRKNDRLGEAGWRVMTRLMQACGVKHIICSPPYEVCYEAWKGRKGEMYANPVIHRRIYDRYIELENAYQGGCVYRWTGPGAFKELCAWLEIPEPTLPEFHIGDPTAKILLVGDRGARPRGLTPDLPFFGTDNSSQYLTRALDASGLSSQGFALVNSWSHTGRGLIPIDQRFEHVIALGNNAHQMLNWQNIPHKKVYHPQYHRRFHFHEIEEYAQQLREAAEI